MYCERAMLESGTIGKIDAIFELVIVAALEIYVWRCSTLLC